MNVLQNYINQYKAVLDINDKMFLVPKSLILFLKDHVTLVTEVMVLKTQLCITGINYILNIY